MLRLLATTSSARRWWLTKSSNLKSQQQWRAPARHTIRTRSSLRVLCLSVQGRRADARFWRADARFWRASARGGRASARLGRAMARVPTRNTDPAEGAVECSQCTCKNAREHEGSVHWVHRAISIGCKSSSALGARRKVHPMQIAECTQCTTPPILGTDHHASPSRVISAN